ARRDQAVLRPLHAGDLRARFRAPARAPRPGARLPRRVPRVSGELALVLHTHMPYVEGFGTWPFGEEWLWEAIATSYVRLLAALSRRAASTSAATHAVLPLLATDAGIRLQVRTGIDAHRRRAGGWEGGFWLPECGYAPWLDPLLGQEGVRAVCVDLTDLPH